MDPNVRGAVLTGCLLCLASAAPCLGQTRFALGAGPSIPVGDLGDASSSGFHTIATTFLGSAGRTVNARIDLSYSHFFADRSGQNSPSNVWAVNVGAIVAPRTARPARPYVTAGAGWYLTPRDCPSRTNFGLNGGLGVRFRRIAIESRFHLVYTGCNSFFHIPVTVAVLF